MSRPMYIAIEGPAGVGKTSLAKMLAPEFNARLILEEPERKPFLESFYENPGRYAIQVQLYFLLTRYRQQQEIVQLDLFEQGTVADYLFAKDRIFGYLILQADELALYGQIFSIPKGRIVKPEMVIYLQAGVDVLAERMRRRGQEYEKNIAEEYLKASVGACSESFYYSETQLLVVNTNDIDFVNHRADFRDLFKEISATKKGTWHYIPLGSRKRDLDEKSGATNQPVWGDLPERAVAGRMLRMRTWPFGYGSGRLFCGFRFSGREGEKAWRNAGRAVKETGCDLVKLEGGQDVAELIAAITRLDIQVMAHIGHTPQSIHRMGGHRVQGRDEAQRAKLFDDAKAVQDAGTYSVVIEGVPSEVAGEITARLEIPTIGIGAGPDCDGQMLVFHDLADSGWGRKAKFVKQYTHVNRFGQKGG